MIKRLWNLGLRILAPLLVSLHEIAPCFHICMHESLFCDKKGVPLDHGWPVNRLLSTLKLFSNRIGVFPAFYPCLGWFLSALKLDFLHTDESQICIFYPISPSFKLLDPDIHWSFEYPLGYPPVISNSRSQLNAPPFSTNLHSKSNDWKPQSVAQVQTWLGFPSHLLQVGKWSL